MNNNTFNSTGNNNDSNKNVPFKAYLLNKYEHLKELRIPVDNNRTSLDTLLLESQEADNRSIKPFETHNSAAYKFPLLKSVYPMPSDLVTDFSPGMYTSKASTSSNNSFTSDALTRSISLKLNANNSPSNINNSNSKLNLSGSNSSLMNSDDDDDYGDTVNNGNLFGADRSREEKRRISHTAAEQKRRNAIKHGYDDLQSIVPSCEFMDPSSSQKVCKATVLKRSIDYIHEMEKEKDNHEMELDSLKKEIMALKIMKSNYEEILQFHRNQPKDNSVEINNDAIFDLFITFTDKLFQTFQSMVSGNSFSEMTSSTLNWLEHVCTAKNLKNMVLLTLYKAVK